MVALASFGGMVWWGEAHPAPPPSLPSTPSIASKPDPVLALIQAHRCWTDAAPHGQVPSRVVYSSPATHGEARLGGPHMTGLALEQEFGARTAGLTVYAFCP